MQGGFQMAATCDACEGSGIVTPKGSECISCHGDGVIKETKVVRVDIPAGIDDGMRIKVTGQGDAPLVHNDLKSAKSQRGDLYVHIKVAPHTNFSRNGADILYTATVPFTTALLGGRVKIPTLDGEVDLTVRSGTNSGDKVTIPGAGMRRLEGRRKSPTGDLRVEYKISMPRWVLFSFWEANKCGGC